MAVRAYYNEIDPYCTEWLRNLIFHGLIADGDVDTRSIEDVLPADLKGYTQCHFFAGIGVWSLALRNAGWRDDEPVWTGSCPCQPFSAAGKRGGAADERHLWPAWSWLIRQCQPRVVFGEQVASKDGRNWLDLVQADLEAMDFAVGAGDICAAGVGAPHIRQRLHFVADSRYRHEHDRRQLAGTPGEAAGEVRDERLWPDTRDGKHPSELADAERDAGEPGRLTVESAESDGAAGAGTPVESRRRGDSSLMVDAERERGRGGESGRKDAEDVGVSSQTSFWSACDWLPCIDGKARPVEPGTFPLAHGDPARVGRLRAYGNAIVAPLAEEFIEAYRSAR